MTPGARAAAAIEVLEDILHHHRPALRALGDWGHMHRFAGSADRAAIGNIVLDALRRKNSLAWRMEDGSPRALVLAHLRFDAGHSPEEIERMGRERHGFGPLSSAERVRLAEPRALEGAPPWVRGDYPEWLHSSLLSAFGTEDETIAATRALARRAPLDIRANALRGSREAVAEALKRHGPEATPLSPWGLRFHEDTRGRLPKLTNELAFHRGDFEIQDEGSQVAALLCPAEAGASVLDYCAGGGGKTLALAARMRGRGRIYAHDAELGRLSPIIERLRRAGVEDMVDIVAPHERDKLEPLRERMDLVLVDAPCSGSGTWRRKPDIKWRLREKTLERRLQTQAKLLDEAAAFVRPGGYLVYVTCSVLPQENAGQVAAFLERSPEFAPQDWRGHAEMLTRLPAAADDGPFLQLSPHRHGTDGFFIALLRKGEKSGG